MQSFVLFWTLRNFTFVCIFLTQEAKNVATSSTSTQINIERDVSIVHDIAIVKFYISWTSVKVSAIKLTS